MFERSNDQLIPIAPTAPALDFQETMYMLCTIGGIKARDWRSVEDFFTNRRAVKDEIQYLSEEERIEIENQRNPFTGEESNAYYANLQEIERMLYSDEAKDIAQIEKIKRNFCIGEFEYDSEKGILITCAEEVVAQKIYLQIQLQTLQPADVCTDFILLEGSTLRIRHSGRKGDHGVYTSDKEDKKKEKMPAICFRSKRSRNVCSEILHLTGFDTTIGLDEGIIGNWDNVLYLSKDFFDVSPNKPEPTFFELDENKGLYITFLRNKDAALIYREMFSGCNTFIKLEENKIFIAKTHPLNKYGVITSFDKNEKLKPEDRRRYNIHFPNYNIYQNFCTFLMKQKEEYPEHRMAMDSTGLSMVRLTPDFLQENVTIIRGDVVQGDDIPLSSRYDKRGKVIFTYKSVSAAIAIYEKLPDLHFIKFENDRIIVDDSNVNLSRDKKTVVIDFHHETESDLLYCAEILFGHIKSMQIELPYYFQGAEARSILIPKNVLVPLPPTPNVPKYSSANMFPPSVKGTPSTINTSKPSPAYDAKSGIVITFTTVDEAKAAYLLAQKYCSFITLDGNIIYVENSQTKGKVHTNGVYPSRNPDPDKQNEMMIGINCQHLPDSKNKNEIGAALQKMGLKVLVGTGAQQFALYIPQSAFQVRTENTLKI